ncbi:MAG: hypothetical protein GXX85_11010 [Ignavibacteria bacterium]|nr:hypothetical protein [Ignavibacteria bacterium]
MRFCLTLIFFSIIVFSGCSNEKRERELLNKVSDLETKLDECQNGADKLHARIKIAFEKEDFKLCKSIYEEMEKRHPNSELYLDVREIYQKVITIENKKEEDLRKQSEKEQKEKLRALNKLKKEYDDVLKITWYKQPYFTHYTNTNLTSIYIGDSGTSQWLRLMMSYKGDNWIFFDQAFLAYDENTMEIFFDKYSDKKTENDSGVWEWIDVTVTDEVEAFLRNFAKSKNAKMRLSGKYTRTRNLSVNERLGILDVLNGYDALKESKTN